MSRKDSVSSVLETIPYDPTEDQKHRNRSWSMNVRVAASTPLGVSESAVPQLALREKETFLEVPSNFQLHSAAVFLVCLASLVLPTIASISYQMLVYSAQSDAQKSCTTMVRTVQVSMLSQTQLLLLSGLVQYLRTNGTDNSHYSKEHVSHIYTASWDNIYAILSSIPQLELNLDVQCHSSLMFTSDMWFSNESLNLTLGDLLADIDRVRSCYAGLANINTTWTLIELERLSDIPASVLKSVRSLHSCVSLVNSMESTCSSAVVNVSDTLRIRLLLQSTVCEDRSSQTALTWIHQQLDNVSSPAVLDQLCLLRQNITESLADLDLDYLQQLDGHFCERGRFFVSQTVKSQGVLSAHLLVLFAVSALSIALFAQVFQKFMHIFKEMSKFADQVSEDSKKIIKEQVQSDTLLHQMLPRSVVKQLKKGESVEAEYFDKVTIYFSDIVGFNDIALSQSPIEIVNLLNTLYGTFDEVVETYDVYKVETIGDAYMVASGLPERNGDNHASEIAAMALAMSAHAANYSLPGASGPLPLRIGINSGPCVAGVIGLKNPRYCLFGDTINTASRMESTGEAYRIHSSESFKHAVDLIGGFQFELRGTIKVKGKGCMTTYWLTGRHRMSTRTKNFKYAPDLEEEASPVPPPV